MRETVTKTKSKNNQKGITLIALVITIIVLLILAGVAISMLSGENGILKQAANAKVETEQAQESENRQLKSMELIMDIQQSNNNSQIKVSYGFITNIDLGTKVSELKKNLTGEYSIYPKEGIGDTPVGDTADVTTGMIVAKNGQEMARTLIFGDVNCDGDIDMTDLTPLVYLINGTGDPKDYQTLAMDVNHDEIINRDDVNVIQWYSMGNFPELSQNIEVSDVSSITVEDTTEQEKFIASFKNDTYSIVFNEDWDGYALQGGEAQKNVKTLKDTIQNSVDTKYEVVIIDDYGNICDDSDNLDMGQIMLKDFYKGIDRLYFIAYF